MNEYSMLPYHKSQVSITPSATILLGSDRPDDESGKEEDRLLEEDENDSLDLEKESYDESHGHSRVGNTARLYLRPRISRLRIPTTSELKINATSVLIALLPSFFLPLIGRSTPRKLHPTSHLDGLRGYAALFVVFDHVKGSWYPRYGLLDIGYGSTPDPKENSLFLQLPIIRLLHNGEGMVAIFFVVSGYALSYKALKLIRKRDSATLLDSAASMIFRRHMRLYLPLVFTSFTAMLLAYWGAYPDRAYDWIPRFEGEFETQLLDWWTKFIEMANPFRPVILSNSATEAFKYDRNLWTIPIEFRGSMVVFLTQLGLAKVRTVIRMLVIIILVIFCFYYAIWDLFLFLAGLLIADIHMETNQEIGDSSAGVICPPTFHQSPKSPWSLCWKKAKPFVSTIFWLATFISALYITGFPVRNAANTPGYKTLNSWIPENWLGENLWRRFWAGNGAVLLVFCVGSVKFLQWPFTTSFGQYLGRISFSLYMVHGIWLHTFGRQMMPWFLRVTGQTTLFGWGFVAWFIVFFIQLIWITDLVMRGLDEKCVAFTRWFANICADKSH